MSTCTKGQVRHSTLFSATFNMSFWRYSVNINFSKGTLTLKHDAISHPFWVKWLNRGPWSLCHLWQYSASDNRYGLIINPWRSKTSWLCMLLKSTIYQAQYRAKPIIWISQGRVSPLLAAEFMGLHVTEPRWFVKCKLRTHMRKTTIPSRYWSKAVKQPVVTHLQLS